MLVYCARADDVVTTIIDGRVVMRDGEVQTVDEEKAVREAARYGAGLYDEGLRGWREARQKST